MEHMTSQERRELVAQCAVVAAAAVVAGLVTAVLAVAATGFYGVAQRAAGVAAVAVLVAGALVVAVYRRRVARQQARIAQLAERVGLVVRDASNVQSFADYEEGELAVLANELQKACTLLREQAEALRFERDGLADSLADISHQLRTPLSSMNIELGLLDRPEVSPERRRALVRELQGLSNHMAWLVNALLTLARADAGTLRFTSAPVDVLRLVDEAVAPLRIAFELAGVELAVSCDPDVGVLACDAGWSREALANVAKNCLEHTPAGGTVRIEAHRDALAVRIVVSDTGPGIAAHDLPHLFERFYRGEGSAAGSAGIGLALARCLVSAQGGTLVAANGASCGARFTFSFPHVRG